jgi:hypothetical protein
LRRSFIESHLSVDRKSNRDGGMERIVIREIFDVIFGRWWGNRLTRV